MLDDTGTTANCALLPARSRHDARPICGGGRSSAARPWTVSRGWRVAHSRPASAPTARCGPRDTEHPAGPLVVRGERRTIAMADRDDTGPRTYSADDVRQGEIILRTRWRRIVFIAGLVGFVILALVLRFAFGA